MARRPLSQAELSKLPPETLKKTLQKRIERARAVVNITPKRKA